jgi:hypothetical protein
LETNILGNDPEQTHDATRCVTTDPRQFITSSLSG